MEALQEFAKTLACPLCSELLRSPSTFSTCGHTFCHECVISRLEGPGISTSHCPECKQPGWKKDLRPNYQLQNAVDHLKSLQILTVPFLKQHRVPDVPENAAAIYHAPAEGDQLESAINGSGAKETHNAESLKEEGSCLSQRACSARNQPVSGDQDPADAQEVSAPVQGGPAHQSPLQLDFGAANFSEEWKEAELGRPPPADAAALDALSREIALLEAALELCDTVPCVDAMAEAAAGNLPSCPHDTQRGPSASQQSKRKLSAMTGAAVLPDAPGEAPCSIEVPETEQQRIGSPTQCTSALDAPSMPQQLCVAGEEEADVGAQQGAADGAAPTATALKRRRMEQTMAAAEAAAERAIRSDHIGRVQLGLQQNRAGAAGGVQGGGPAVAPAIGSRVEVVWTDGLYTGVVQAANAFEGTHLIVYDDGDVQWHDLSKEEWTLVEAAPNAPEANPEPPAAVHRHGTGSDPEPHATSAPEPSGNSAEDLAHQPSAPAVAAAATAEPTAVIPDSQEDNGQLSEDGPTAPLPSVRASGHRGAGSPGTQGALLGTQAAAEALHILRAGGDAFILASQLPREEHPPAGGPTHKAPSAALGINGTRLYGAEVTPRSLSRLGGREESQPTGSSSQASQGQRRRAARPGSASIKDLLRAKQAAAQAEQEAMQSRQIYLAFSHSDPVVVSKAKALAEALPCVTLQQAVDEMTTHVLVPTNEYAVAKERSARLIQALAAGCWVLSYTWLDACLELGRRVPEHTYEVKGCRTKGGSGRVQDIRPRRREKGEPGLFAGTLIFVPGWSQKDAKALGRRDLAIQVAKLAGGEVIEEVTSAEQRMQCVTVAESALKAEGFHFRGFSKAVEFSWVTESLLAGRLLPFPRYGDADD